MHMLHVTIGVIYLGVVAFRKWFLPVLAVIWIAAAFMIPSDNVFHYAVHALVWGCCGGDDFVPEAERL